MATNKTTISIIIVNYKSWHHLQNCLNAINKITLNSISLEVVVIDNTLDAIKIDEFAASYPNFNFYLNSGNNGFANGCNLGAEKATGSYFLFLNPDTIIAKEPILEMYKAIANSPNL